MQLWHSCSPDLEARKEAAEFGTTVREAFVRASGSSEFSDKPRARAAGEETRGVGNTRVVAARTHAPDDGELLLELGGVAIEALAVGADHEFRAASGMAFGPEPGRLRGGGDGGREDRDAGARGARGADSHGGEDTRRRGGGGGHRGCSCALRCAGEELTRYLLIESFYDVAPLAPPGGPRWRIKNRHVPRAFSSSTPASRARSFICALAEGAPTHLFARGVGDAAS